MYGHGVRPDPSLHPEIHNDPQTVEFGPLYLPPPMTLAPGTTLGAYSVTAKVGVVLMGLSVALWVALPVIPFLPIHVGMKATVAGSQIVVAEVAFWLGAALAGPEATRRMRSWWRSSRTEEGS